MSEVCAEALLLPPWRCVLHLSLANFKKPLADFQPPVLIVPLTPAAVVRETLKRL